MDSAKLAASRLADKYITRDGDDPPPEYASTDAEAEALHQLASFLGWHEGHELMGGVTADQAWEAMCTLLGFSEQRGQAIRKVIRGEA